MLKRQIAFISTVSFVTVLLLAACGKNEGSVPAATPDTAARSPGVVSSTSHAMLGGQFSDYQDVTGLSALKKVGVCSLENVISVSDGSNHPGTSANSYQVTRDAAYKLIGFATDKEAGRVPVKIKMVLIGARTFALDAVTGRDRPDVAKFFKIPALHDAGFQVDASFDQVPVGSYDVSILEMDSNTICPTHQTIKVE